MGFLDNIFNRHHLQEANNSNQEFNCNPSAKIFNTTKIREIEDLIAKKYSVVDAPTDNFETDTFNTTFNNLTYTPLITDKSTRIAAYRRMALYPEVDWCLNEIADDFIHEDENGDIIHLSLPENSTRITDPRRQLLQDEFKKFIDLFNLKDEGYTICKRFLVEGETAFENIIDPEQPLKGIIGVKYLPTDFYETLIDTSNGRAVGIYFNKQALSSALQRLTSQGYTASTEIFSSMLDSSSQYSSDGDNCLTMLWPQITYISTGNISPDGRITFPAIDAAKQPYHQLSLLHDAAVILRVTRAPERLVFNIATGGVSDKIARQQVREFVNSMNAKRAVNDKNKITQTYNPISMLESYYFWKSNANDGTDVSTVSSTANYDEMADIKYFLQRLFKQFKVPYSRYATPENTVEKNDSITYEEYSFSRMLLRLQRRFAIGLRRSFITHLKLRDIWGQYGLKESDIGVTFTRPVLYDLYQAQKLFSIKVENYNSLAEHEELSKEVAMKKFLGYTDEDIRENNLKRVKESMINALCDYAAQKISDNGPESADYLPDEFTWKEPNNPTE